MHSVIGLTHGQVLVSDFFYKPSQNWAICYYLSNVKSLFSLEIFLNFRRFFSIQLMVHSGPPNELGAKSEIGTPNASTTLRLNLDRIHAQRQYCSKFGLRA